MIREKEIASLVKFLLDCDAGIKHISQDITANVLFTLVFYS